MTIEEIQQLRKGDIVHVPFVVDEARGKSAICLLPRNMEEEFTFYPVDIESWERPRRKFRQGDVVVTLGGTLCFVAGDENAEGVGLDFLPENARRSASELTLVMTAEEYERMGKKGGADA